MFVAILNFLQAWRRYNASLSELYQLGDRELADIGITRSDIPRIAWESADREIKMKSARFGGLFSVLRAARRAGALRFCVPKGPSTPLSSSHVRSAATA